MNNKTTATIYNFADYCKNNGITADYEHVYDAITEYVKESADIMTWLQNDGKAVDYINHVTNDFIIFFGMKFDFAQACKTALGFELKEHRSDIIEIIKGGK